MQKIYFIKLKYYHSHEEKKRKKNVPASDHCYITAAIILVSHCLTLYNLNGFLFVTLLVTTITVLYDFIVDLFTWNRAFKIFIHLVKN